MQDRNDQLKMAFGCLDCRWREWPRGLDWDHVRGVKITNIAIMIANGRPWSEIEVEMAKCELVCANCHRIRTCERRVMGSGVMAPRSQLDIVVEKLWCPLKSEGRREQGG